jgi:general stress protein CsbA
MNIKLLVAGIVVIIAAIIFPIIFTSIRDFTAIVYADYTAYFVGAVLIFASIFAFRK